MKVRLSTIAALSVAFLSGSALFLTSQQVQTEEDRLEILSQAVAREEETIRVLAAEWSYLNQPERMELLAQEYLGMQPSQAGQILSSASGLPDPFIPALPRRKPVLEARPAVFTLPSPAPSFPEINQNSRPAARADTRSFQSLLGQLEGEAP